MQWDEKELEHSIHPKCVVLDVLAKALVPWQCPISYQALFLLLITSDNHDG